MQKDALDALRLQLEGQLQDKEVCLAIDLPGGREGQQGQAWVQAGPMCEECALTRRCAFLRLHGRCIRGAGLCARCRAC